MMSRLAVHDGGATCAKVTGPSIIPFEEFLPRSRALMRAGEKSGQGRNSGTDYNIEEGKERRKDGKL